nr:hypothetical protein [Bacillus pumilus]
MLEKDQEQSTSDLKNEEPSIDQETRQSRLGRSAAKRGRTSKAKAASWLMSVLPFSVSCKV